jgi:hypothetical protein
MRAVFADPGYWVLFFGRKPRAPTRDEDTVDALEQFEAIRGKLGES